MKKYNVYYLIVVSILSILILISSASAGLFDEMSKTVNDVQKKAGNVQKEAAKTVNEVQKKAENAQKEATKKVNEVQKQADDMQKEGKINSENWNKVVKDWQKEAEKKVEQMKKSNMNENVKNIYNNYQKINELQSKSDIITKVAVNSMRLVPIYDPKDGKTKSLDNMMREMVSDIPELKGSDLEKDPVKTGMQMMIGGEFMMQSKLIRNPNGGWMSIEDALATGFKLDEVPKAKMEFETARTAYLSGDPKTLESSISSFFSSINKINTDPEIEKNWNKIEKKVFNNVNMQGMEKEDMVRQAQDIWMQAPKEVRDDISHAAEKETEIITPIYLSTQENGDPKITFMKASPMEGKIEFYEPNERQIKTLATEVTVDYITAGAVNLDDVRNLDLIKGKENKYKVKINAKGSILKLIPANVEYEAEVNTETGEINDIKKPWWNALLIN